MNDATYQSLPTINAPDDALAALRRLIDTMPATIETRGYYHDCCDRLDVRIRKDANPIEKRSNYEAIG
jgi:hypothetical protein